jgi:hypothetical protein
MKTPTVLLTSVLFLTPNLLLAQYNIDWYRIGGGGGQATGGVYAVSGTIGQNGAGTATGGAFTLVSGYWAVIGTVPMPGFPRLNIERVGDSVRVLWPAAARGDFVLQETDTLDNYPDLLWKDASYPYTTNGAWIYVTIPLSNNSLGVHPRGGEEIKIPAKKVVKFRRR